MISHTTADSSCLGLVVIGAVVIGAVVLGGALRTLADRRDPPLTGGVVLITL